MQLIDDHVSTDGATVRFDVLTELEQAHHNPEIQQLRVHPSDSRAGAHVLAEVEVLDVPVEEADAVEDTLTRWVCSCEDFWFNRVDFDQPVSEWGECKHIRNEVRAKRAAADDDQATLG